MRKVSIEAVAREQLAVATASSAHRAASTVFGGHEKVMRQTVVTLAAGARLAEHLNPGEATVLVLSGRVELVCGGEVWSGRTGDLVIMPAAVHSLCALSDAAVLLTAVPLTRRT